MQFIIFSRYTNEIIVSPNDYEMETSPVSHQQDSQPQVTLVKTSEGSPNKAAIPNSPTPQNKQKHPQNLPYDPFIHTNNKPPLSFSSLIFLAIEDAHEKALPVKEIYSWIIQHYPYFKTAPTGWKNSVRHNLSLNKCFQKVEKAPVCYSIHFCMGYSYDLTEFIAEYGKRFLMASRTTIQTEPHPSTDQVCLSSGNNWRGEIDYTREIGIEASGNTCRH